MSTLVGSFFLFYFFPQSRREKIAEYWQFSGEHKYFLFITLYISHIIDFIIESMDLTIMYREEVEEFFNTMDRDFDGRLSFEVIGSPSVGRLAGWLVCLS